MTITRTMRASPPPGFGGASIEPPLAISEQRAMTRGVPLQLLGISKSFGSVQALRPMTSDD